MKKLTLIKAGLAALIFSTFSAQAYEDVTPQKAYEMLKDSNTYIIDVRTNGEFLFVGYPAENRLGEGSHLNGKVANISWMYHQGPKFKVNPKFVNDVKFVFKGKKDNHLIMMCRSGSRSVAAAKALEAAGYENIYNMTGGFEGGKDASGYRTKPGSWKNDGLPYNIPSPRDEEAYDINRND